MKDTFTCNVLLLPHPPCPGNFLPKQSQSSNLGSHALSFQFLCWQTSFRVQVTPLMAIHLLPPWAIGLLLHKLKVGSKRHLLFWRAGKATAVKHGSKPQPISSHLGALPSCGAGGGVCLTFWDTFCILSICHAFRPLLHFVPCFFLGWMHGRGVQIAKGVLSTGFCCWALAGSVSCILVWSSGCSEEETRKVGVWRC